MKGNILGLLGICRKAGKLRLGFDPVAEGLGKDVRLLLFSNDISPKTKERMLQKASGSPAASLTLPYSALPPRASSRSSRTTASLRKPWAAL